MDKKLIISWSPKRDEAAGTFVTRVEKTHKGAINYKGEKPKPYDYWAFPIKRVTGKLVWIDKLQKKFGNKFVLVLEGANGNLNVVENSFGVGNIKDICNRLLAIHNDNGQDYSKWLGMNMTLAYWVFKDKVENGVQLYNSNVVIEEQKKGYYNKDERPMPEKLKWTKQLNGKGEEEWNSIEELKFWEKFILGIQKALLTNGTAIPVLPTFYTSLLCGVIANPTGIEQPQEIVSLAQSVWNNVKDKYHFAFMKEQNQSTSDDFRIDDTVDENIFTEGANVSTPIANISAATENTTVVNLEKLNDSEDDEDLGLPF